MLRKTLSLLPLLLRVAAVVVLVGLNLTYSQAEQVPCSYPKAHYCGSLTYYCACDPDYMKEYTFAWCEPDDDCYNLPPCAHSENRCE